jgi:multiple sugar transport system permease protein
VFRGLVLLPWVVPSAMAALIWNWMYNGLVGVVNDVFVKLHLTSEFVVFLGDPQWVMPSVIAVTIWRGVPFATVMLLAGLQSIQPSLYEAAEVDGAGIFTRFRHITLPGIRNIAIITILLAVLWTFNHVDTIYVMTAGGPANLSLTLALYNFRAAFQQFKFGYAASLSVIALLLLLVLTYVYIRVIGEEDGDLV